MQIQDSYIKTLTQNDLNKKIKFTDLWLDPAVQMVLSGFSLLIHL